ncbi:hypothetical protein CN384_06315 [Bacillus thuringiensis]|uniref:hypothetical protein n=2 Tax=Bacillus TaxID=1386 RepID=UPI000BFA8303|nr:hypothetical protein [Bacillus thuringiensis]PFA29350.1 hypothetical protein CN384_06315 [Bacillus thuringiensis]
MADLKPLLIMNVFGNFILFIVILLLLQSPLYMPTLGLSMSSNILGIVMLIICNQKLKDNKKAEQKNKDAVFLFEMRIVLALNYFILFFIRGCHN